MKKGFLLKHYYPETNNNEIKGKSNNKENVQPPKQNVQPPKQNVHTPETNISMCGRKIYFDTDSGKRRSELAKFGKMHSIKMNHNGSKGYCLVCDRYIPACLENFKDHIKGILHRGHLEVKGLQKPLKRDTYEEYQTISAKSFLKTFSFIPEMKAFWINRQFWIDIPSLFLLHTTEDDPHYNRTKCYACDEILEKGKEGQHCLSHKHRINLNAAKVVVADREFIRELRPNFFHCGYCNLTLPYLETLDKHVKTYNHLHSKINYLDLDKDNPKKALKKNYKTNNIDKDGDDMYTQLLPYICSPAMFMFK